MILFLKRMTKYVPDSHFHNTNRSFFVNHMYEGPSDLKINKRVLFVYMEFARVSQQTKDMYA